MPAETFTKRKKKGGELYFFEMTNLICKADALKKFYILQKLKQVFWGELTEIIILKYFFMIIFKFQLGKRGLWISQKLNVKVYPMVFFLLRISWHVVNFLFMHEILKYSCTCLFRKFSIHFLCLFQIKYLKLESELWKMCTWLRYTWNFSFWVCLFWCEFVGRSLFKSWIVFWKIFQIYFEIHKSP